MSNYNFRKDIILGNEAEDKVVNILHKFGYTDAYRVKGKEVRWDIIIPNAGKSIEVKNDILAAKTGNLAIELCKASGELSGIMISEADFWVIFAANEILMLDRPALKEYCINNQLREVWGGDANKTKMALIPISEIKKQSFCGNINVINY